MHKIKYIIYVFFILIIHIFFSAHLRAQIIECKDSNGNKFCLDSYMYPWETYTFFIFNGTANWKMFIENKYDYPVEIKRVENSSQFNTTVDGTTYIWANSKRYESGQTCYYKGFITFDDGKNKDTLIIKLSYVPPKPVIKELKLIYDSYDYENHELVNPDLSGVVNIPHAERLDILSTDFGQDTIECPPYFWSLDRRLSVESVNGDFKFSGEYHGVNQHICFYGINEYGWSIYSDPILINNLIEDQGILDDLYHLSDIQSVTYDIGNFIHIKKGEIDIKSDLLQNLDIFDFTGNLIFHINKPSYGKKLFLKSGIYLIKMRVKDKSLIKKVVL